MSTLTPSTCDYAVQLVSNDGHTVYLQEPCNLPDAGAIKTVFEAYKSAGSHVRVVQASHSTVLAFALKSLGLGVVDLRDVELAEHLKGLVRLSYVPKHIREYAEAALNNLSVLEIALTKLGECSPQQ